MPARLPVALKKQIQALQSRLAAVEAEQAAAREAAVAFVTDAMQRLHLTPADLERTPARRGRRPKAKRASKAKGRRTKRGTRTKRTPAQPRTAAAGGTPTRGRKSAGAAAPRVKKVPPKFQGPGGEQWTGRGKQPRWLTALVAEGRRPEEFLLAGARATA